MTESREMSKAADVMRQTMPNYGPGDTVIKDGIRYMVFSIRYCPLGNGQNCGWRTVTANTGGPESIDRLSSEFTLVAQETAAVSAATVDNYPPFVPGDIIRIVLGSELQQNAKFMLSDFLEVIECFQAGAPPTPEAKYVVRVRRAGFVAPFAPPIDEMECFAAKHFEKCPIKSVTIRYVKDVRLTELGDLHVEYGEVAVPLP